MPLYAQRRTVQGVAHRALVEGVMDNSGETLVGKFVILLQATDFKCHVGDEGWRAGTRANVIVHLPGQDRVIAQVGNQSRTLLIAAIETDSNQAEGG